MKVTACFAATRYRPDRAVILDEWIERVMIRPERVALQRDGRIRLWSAIREADDRYLRVVLLADHETVHNAFFDRRFRP